MKILICGLALSRNLGAPAMLLTMIEQINCKFSNSSFIIAVSSVDIEQELRWLKYYQDMGFNIEKLVPISNIPSYILNITPLRSFYQYIFAKRKKEFYKNQKSRAFFIEAHKEYLKAIQESDIVICMNGINYIGDGVERCIDYISDYSAIYYANKFKKPYARFVQSYGPFDNHIVKFFAKKEFEQLPFLYARGKNTASYCRSIVSDKSKVIDAPDVAILLKTANKEWTENYLSRLGFSNKNYIVLSPSSVIYYISDKANKVIQGSVGKKHVDSFVFIAERLVKEGKNILFLPHMYSDIKFDCDREVCYKIVSRIKNEYRSMIKIVEDDLNPMQAKSLIGCSSLAIVSRYHALVAAISTVTPVIALGWNVKYFDLMEYYGIENMAIDIRLYEPKQVLDMVFDFMKFYENGENMVIYKLLQEKSKQKVLKAFDKLFAWMENNGK